MGKKKSLDECFSALSFVENTNDDLGPKLIHPIIETHCHLDYLKNLPLNEILEKSSAMGIEKIITISVSPENIDQTFKLAQENASIYCSQGIHPHEAHNWDDSLIDKIKEASKNPKVVAVGEIGLDYHYDFSPRKKQIEVLETQLELASKLDLPVILHTREADDDMLSILKNFSSSLKKKGVLHSYTSQIGLAEEAISMGFYLGFNGIISFKNAKNVRDILEATPLENILLETDAPYLTPIPFRGRENSPVYLPFVAQKLIEIKGETPVNTLRQIYENSLNLFSLK